MDPQGTGHSPTRERPPDWDVVRRRPSRSIHLEKLIASLAAEMTHRWNAGERPLVEEFLARYPHLQNDTEAVLDLVAEELRLRRRHGAMVPVAEIEARFPRWRNELDLMVDFHPLLQVEPAGTRFPQAGEVLGDFQLLEELGRGAQGRVFLATQPALADRPVVLKVVALRVHEHLSLARLQHTHIVPLYWHHEDAERGLRLLCMPYFGRLTLASLLQVLPPLPQRSGASLVAALDEARDSYVPGPSRAPLRGLLERASYVQAICWIGACLADALHYAHERGLLHLDVKPSNVLLSSDGTPMLLDFHLAQALVQPDAPPPSWLGGTPHYMAPEHDRAMEAIMAGQPVPTLVDRRADVFSLGALLYEALGGQLPHRPGISAPLSRCNTAVGVGLSDLIDRCLAPQPEQRYSQAADLAADLRRVLADQPLQGVRNRSWVERWGRWRRRNRHILPLMLLGALLLAGLGAGTWEWKQRLNLASGLLATAREQLRQGQFTSAQQSLEHGLSLAQSLPGTGGLQNNFSVARDEAARQQATQELHALVDRVRYLYPFEGFSPQTLQQLHGACLQLWSRRGVIRERLADRESGNTALRADLLDLALLTADLGARMGGGQAEDRQVLAQAQVELGSSPVLAHARWLAGEIPAAELTPPATAWEHYAMGRLCLSAGDLAAASRHLAFAVRQEPASLWPNYYHGQCAYLEKHYHEAMAAFSVCIGAAPRLAGPYVQRALADTALGKLDAALEDYTRALELDPDIGSAWLNRGILRHKGGHQAEALADLLEALHHGADPATTYFNIALVHQACGDARAAREALTAALHHRPDHPEALALARALQGKGHATTKPVAPP